MTDANQPPDRKHTSGPPGETLFPAPPSASSTGEASGSPPAELPIDAPPPAAPAPPHGRPGFPVIAYGVAGLMALGMSLYLEHMIEERDVAGMGGPGLACFIILGFLMTAVSGITGVVVGTMTLRRLRRSRVRAGRTATVVGLVLSGTSLVLLGILIGGAAMRAMAEMRCTTAKHSLMALSNAAWDYQLANNNGLPSADTWPELLKESPKVQPADFLDPSDPKAGRAYAVNVHLNGTLHVFHPDRTPLYFECRFGSPPAGGRELLPGQPRYSGGYLIGFCDGHVDTVPPTEIPRLIWDPAKDTFDD